jgi:hypothetical protein
LLEIAKWSNTSLPHRKHIQKYFRQTPQTKFYIHGKKRKLLICKYPLRCFCIRTLPPPQSTPYTYPHPLDATPNPNSLPR